MEGQALVARSGIQAPTAAWQLDALYLPCVFDQVADTGKMRRNSELTVVPDTITPLWK